jgi:hypothetical protein
MSEANVIPASIPMHAVPERHHWLNVIVGVLDQAFHLNEAEQVFVIAAVGDVLDHLRIPDRSDPQTLPPPIAVEIACGLYAAQLAGPRSSGVVRPVRLTGAHDMVVSVETWRESLVSLLTTAHPDLSSVERLVAAKAFVEILSAIGVPDRAAAFFPDDVVRLSQVMDA